MIRIAKFSPIYGNNIGDLTISDCIEHMLIENNIYFTSYDIIFRKPRSYWSRTRWDTFRIGVSTFLSKNFAFGLSFLKGVVLRARRDGNRYHNLSGGYDAIIVGGGNIIMDKMGSDYALRVREVCMNATCPVGVYAAGAGPLVNDRERIVADIKGAAAFVSVRDKQSRELMGADGVSLNFDPAFIVSDIAPSKRGFGYLGVNVIAGYLDETELRRFADDVADFASSRDLKIRLVVTAYPGDSLESELVRALIVAHSPELVIETVEVGPRLGDVAAAYSNLEFFVGCRMHSLIFALSYGIPSVGFEWDPKVGGMFSMFFGDNFREEMLYRPGRGIPGELYRSIDVSAVAKSVKADVRREFSQMLDSILEDRPKPITP